MIKKAFFFLYLIFSILFIVYLVLPSPKFPDPPPGAVQSMEEADIETPLKKAYFTNYTREQVIDHYLNQFNRHSILLNYPPEDAQTIIRDQTRSRYLQELVHPFRESLFINGFIPMQAKDDIWYKGVHYEEKITIKYIPSNPVVRVTVVIATLIVAWKLLDLWIITLADLVKVLPLKLLKK
ncbi:hypothetical protein KW795_01245 [Candidatus Microgenomates bacterium]|nr:hypothetical protein [Candidatus Microgenomates bacterium]